MPANAGMLIPQWLYVPAILSVVITFYWNGLYFLGRVIDNYAVRRTQEAFKVDMPASPAARGITS